MAAQPQSAGVKVPLFLSNWLSNWEWVQSVSQFLHGSYCAECKCLCPCASYGAAYRYRPRALQGHRSSLGRVRFPLNLSSPDPNGTTKTSTCDFTVTCGGHAMACAGSRTPPVRLFNTDTRRLQAQEGVPVPHCNRCYRRRRGWGPRLGGGDLILGRALAPMAPSGGRNKPGFLNAIRVLRYAETKGDCI